MAERSVAAKALSQLLNALSHADRIRIVEELRDGEKDVGTLAENLDTGTVRVSQHLSILRAAHLVTERREGRHVFYRLTHPALARWLLDGLRFVEPDARVVEELRDAVSTAVALWSTDKAD